MEKNKTIILVDPKLYSLEAVYGAAYVFLDKAYIFLERGPKTKIRVIFKNKKKPLKNLKDEFLNELLNFSLRDKISKNNKKIREYIVSRALASAVERPITLNEKPLGQTLEQRERPLWKQDPSGVVVPWIEKKQEEENEIICEKDLINFVIPWDKKTSNIKVQKRENKKSWEKDSLGIAVPWEEKYSRKKSSCEKNTRVAYSKKTKRK